jgi:hypothetical protein
MKKAASLEEIERLFAKRDGEGAFAALGEFVQTALRDPTDRDAAVSSLASRLDRAHVALAARLALAGGALVENGAPATALGRAIVAPLTRALVAARRLLDRATDIPEEKDEEGTRVGDRTLSRGQIDAIAEEDPEAVNAWFSLDVWYRPAVATWTSDTSVLREAKANPEFRAALSALGARSEGSYWLSILVDSCVDTRFVVLVPELEEAWTFVASGVTDMGQLSVLMSEALADPLKRLRASGVANPRVLSVMRGESQQQCTDGYSASFHCYPWQSLDLESGLPKDGVFTWLAPGGTGQHSLPPDFQPETITPVDGTRVLLLAGPKSPGMRFIREIGATRMFRDLRARLTSVERLSSSEAQLWTEKVRCARAR